MAKTRRRLRALRDPAATDQTLDVLLPADATPEDVAEAQRYIDTLEANKRIARQPGPLPPGATHQVVVGRDGRRRLVRKRFSAI
jgi:hypothetical protein